MPSIVAEPEKRAVTGVGWPGCLIWRLLCYVPALLCPCLLRACPATCLPAMCPGRSGRAGRPGGGRGDQVQGRAVPRVALDQVAAAGCRPGRGQVVDVLDRLARRPALQQRGGEPALGELGGERDHAQGSV